MITRLVSVAGLPALKGFQLELIHQLVEPERIYSRHQATGTGFDDERLNLLGLRVEGPGLRLRRLASFTRVMKLRPLKRAVRFRASAKSSSRVRVVRITIQKLLRHPDVFQGPGQDAAAAAADPAMDALAERVILHIGLVVPAAFALLTFGAGHPQLEPNLLALR
jgi:hypothetical protein